MPCLAKGQSTVALLTFSLCLCALQLAIYPQLYSAFSDLLFSSLIKLTCGLFVHNRYTMPLERCDAILDLCDPNIVLGPRKRRATERLLENGDPLAWKKKKMALSTDVTVSNTHADEGDHTSSLTPPQPPLAHIAPNPRQATNLTESSDDRPSDKAPAIVVEDSNEEASSNGSDKGRSDEGGSDKGESTEEDDKAELSMCFVTLVDFQAFH